MEREDIDNYIAKFENLLQKAEIPWGKAIVMDLFRNRLKKGLHSAIFREQTWPTNLDK